jgi:hypothetical protein
MPRKPETNVRKKVEALNRHKALIDALITFIAAHPDIASEATLQVLWGKTGLKFYDYAIIIPGWNKGKIALRLVKSGSDWFNSMDSDAVYRMNHTVSRNVMNLSEKQLDKLLDRIYWEANPDADQEEE